MVLCASHGAHFSLFVHSSFVFFVFAATGDVFFVLAATGDQTSGKPSVSELLGKSLLYVLFLLSLEIEMMRCGGALRF